MSTTLTSPDLQAKTSVRYFMPPELTPLYQTPVYAELSEEQRVSYNQFHALYFHEQIIFFEQSIICPALASVRNTCPESTLQSSISEFIAEENKHSARFHQLLQQTAPGMYANSTRFFIHNSPVESVVLNWCVTHPRLFPIYLWLILLLEERAMYCGRVFLNHEEELSVPFFQIQRQHLADEVDHVQWDEEVIESVWPKTSPWLRRWNVKLMDWMLREFIVAPKRAAVRVLDAVIARHPALQPLLPRLQRELRELGRNPEFQQSIFCTPVAPRSARLMSKYPEFDSFRAYWFRHDN